MKPTCKITYNKYFSTTCLITLLIFFSNVSAESNKRSLMVSFAPGEVIQLIAPISVPEKQAERTSYYQNAIPLAQQYGFKNLGQLSVDQTLVGNFAPGAFVIGSWPSIKAMQAFEQHPDWPSLKTTRLNAWEELKLFNLELQEPTSLTFVEGKTYTAAFAWTNPENPSAYYEYLDSVQPLLEKVGARFIFKMKRPDIEAHDPNAKPPQQITFVEWDSADGLQQLQALPEYKQYSALLRSGTIYFEFHKLKTNLKS